jgi:hypothetical protein
VKPAAGVMSPLLNRSVTCPVAAFGVMHAGPEMVTALRRNPVPAPGAPLPASFLKHADEQTVVALAAVYQGIHNHNLAGTDFSRWGVVAAPCFPGRGALVQVLKRQAVEGAWGVSPHLIPHHSVHAVSGTVSQVLRIHGPNFGIGGGPQAIVEALTVAATLAADRSLPGLWLVLTEHDPEYSPADPSAPASNGHQACPLSLALALVPQRVASMGLELRICPQTEAVADEEADCALPERRRWTSWPALTGVGPLAAAFSQNGLPAGRWRFGHGGWVELTGERRMTSGA